MLILLYSLPFLIDVVVSEPQANKLASKYHVWTPEYGGNQWERSGGFQGDILIDNKMKQEAPHSYNWPYNKKLWPNGIIPYTINISEFNNVDVNIILEAMKTIEDVLPERRIANGTCQIKFVRRTLEQNYLDIRGNLDGICNSYMGMVIGSQELNLGSGCRVKGIVLHELCHALGLGHEHAAYNRDKYVKIHWENIKPEGKGQFSRRRYPEFSPRVPYDLDSIMHYSSQAYAVGGEPTITPYDTTKKIGQLQGLSKIDKLKLILLYCPKRNQ